MKNTNKLSDTLKYRWLKERCRADKCSLNTIDAELLTDDFDNVYSTVEEQREEKTDIEFE